MIYFFRTMLKPQDILLLLKLHIQEGRQAPYAQLARELGISSSEVFAGVQRLVSSRLIDSTSAKPRRQLLANFLIHGVCYLVPAELGGSTRGFPTAYAVSPLRDLIVTQETDLPVWPDPLGTHRGFSLSPLYSSVPYAAQKDLALYEYLALIDALRLGDARLGKLAEAELRQRLETVSS